ncbi:MAG: type II secretion system F family protein [Actinobacteria bacterium]|nr:type II secretion system F family protein [Actinomycetota bacterium]
MMWASVLLLACSAFLFRTHLVAERQGRASSLLKTGSGKPAPERDGWEGLRGAARRFFSAERRKRFLFIAACVLILALTRNPLLCLLPPLVLPAATRFLREYRGRREEMRKEEQVLEFIDSLTQSLRSGLSLQQSLQVCLEDVGRELGAELEELVREIRAGSGLEESLLHASERTGSPSMRHTLTVLRLLHGRGGDLPRVLERLRDRVYEALEARRELRMLTSQSRASGYLVSALPLAFLSIQAALNPSSLKPILATPAGNLMALVALSLNGAAFLLIRRMTEGV